MSPPTTLTAGRIHAGKWVLVHRSDDGKVLRLEWPKREWPYGRKNEPKGAA